MAFSVARSRPFRSLGLYKANGRHAAPKGYVPEPRSTADHATGHAALGHRPAHAATMPRLTGPHASDQPEAPAAPAGATRPANTQPADTRTGAYESAESGNLADAPQAARAA